MCSTIRKYFRTGLEGSDQRPRHWLGLWRRSLPTADRSWHGLAPSLPCTGRRGWLHIPRPPSTIPLPLGCRTPGTSGQTHRYLVLPSTTLTSNASVSTYHSTTIARLSIVRPQLTILPLYCSSVRDMDKVQDRVVTSQSTLEPSRVSPSASSSTTSPPESFVFTSSQYASSSSRQRRSELSRGLRSRHAQGATDIRSTLPFPMGTNGFVPLPNSPRLSALPTSAPARTSDNGSRGTIDYFSPRQPSTRASASTASAYNWFATPSEGDSSVASTPSVASTTSTGSNVSSYSVPSTAYFPREIDLSLVELFAVARQVRKEKQRSRARGSSTSQDGTPPSAANSGSDDTPRRRPSHSGGSDLAGLSGAWFVPSSTSTRMYPHFVVLFSADSEALACERRLRLFAEPEHGGRKHALGAR